MTKNKNKKGNKVGTQPEAAPPVCGISFQSKPNKRNKVRGSELSEKVTVPLNNELVTESSLQTTSKKLDKNKRKLQNESCIASSEEGTKDTCAVNININLKGDADTTTINSYANAKIDPIEDHTTSVKVTQDQLTEQEQIKEIGECKSTDNQVCEKTNHNYKSSVKETNKSYNKIEYRQSDEKNHEQQHDRNNKREEQDGRYQRNCWDGRNTNLQNKWVQGAPNVIKNSLDEEKTYEKQFYKNKKEERKGGNQRSDWGVQSTNIQNEWELGASNETKKAWDEEEVHDKQFYKNKKEDQKGENQRNDWGVQSTNLQNEWGQGASNVTKNFWDEEDTHEKQFYKNNQREEGKGGNQRNNWSVQSTDLQNNWEQGASNVTKDAWDEEKTHEKQFHKNNQREEWKRGNQRINWDVQSTNVQNELEQGAARITKNKADSNVNWRQQSNIPDFKGNDRESRHHPYEHQNRNRFSQKDDHYEDYKSFCKLFKGNFVKVNEIEEDLFKMPDEFSLAHCVAEDMNMGSGIAVQFSQKFKRRDELYQQREKQGGLAVLDVNNSKFIYYLVTKRISSGKPTMYTMFSSLQRLQKHIEQHQVKKLAIPRIGCGLDRLEWKDIKLMLEFIFLNTDVEITVCNFQQNHGKTKTKLVTSKDQKQTKIDKYLQKGKNSQKSKKK